MTSIPVYVYDQLAAIRARNIIPPATLAEWRPTPIDPVRCVRCQRGIVQGTKRPICWSCENTSPYAITLQAASWKPSKNKRGKQRP